MSKKKIYIRIDENDTLVGWYKTKKEAEKIAVAKDQIYEVTKWWLVKNKVDLQEEPLSDLA